MKKHCPFCNAELPDEAAFCPFCASSLTQKTETVPPKHLSLKKLRIAALCVAVLLLCGTLLFLRRPKTYDGLGEVIYTDADGTYQLMLSTLMENYTPVPEIHQFADGKESYRFPSWLYINHMDSGANAGDIFLRKLESAEVKILQPEDSVSPVLCKEPVPKDSNPNAALWTPIDYTSESPEQTQIVWTLRMKNGDTILLRADFHITPTENLYYDASSLDLSDSEALQASIDYLVKNTDYWDRVTITLPAVTYTEPLILHGRTFDLEGSEENGQRTCFSAGIQMRQINHAIRISYLTGIDFTGDGSGIGISAAGRLWTKNCSFSNWKTAVLGYGSVWINTTDCRFENNATGLHYNAENTSASDSRFIGNHFQNNEIAVLLENVPTDLTMNFADCVFTGNGTDISNLCDQPIDISQAVFQ